MISKELGEDPPEDYNLPDQMVPELIAELDKKTLDDVREFRVLQFYFEMLRV